MNSSGRVQVLWFFAICKWANTTKSKSTGRLAPFRYKKGIALFIGPISLAQRELGSQYALQHFVDRFAKDLAAVEECHLFFRPKIDIDHTMHAAATDDGGDRNRHIAEAVCACLQARNW
jgi:hypothetical protein